MACTPHFRGFAAQIAPLNLVIDARNMTILSIFVGNQEAVLWQYIEGELAARASAAP